MSENKKNPTADQKSDLENSKEFLQADYVVVKALEDGVNLIALTRGRETRFHHTEKLDKDEVMLFQFTAHTSAMKVRGKSEIYTEHGVIKSGE